MTAIQDEPTPYSHGAQPRTHSTSPVGTTPCPEHPQSMCDRRCLHVSSCSSSCQVATTNTLKVLPKWKNLIIDHKGTLTQGSMIYDHICVCYSQYHFKLIMEHSQMGGFMPCLGSTPYGQTTGEASLQVPTGPTTREATHMFMAPCLISCTIGGHTPYSIM